jgi:hypothetical protein
MVMSLGGLDYFLPIFAFLFVFILVFALLKKTNILENNGVAMILSFIVSVFFIVNIQLVDYVQFNAGVFGVFLVVVVLIMLVISFVKGEGDSVLDKGSWFSWANVIILILIFVVYSSYFFNWAVNWELLRSWAYSDWFGFLLLLVVAVIAGWVVSKKAE